MKKRTINITSPEGVCQSCLQKYSDNPIWKDLGHFKSGAIISVPGFLHLNGCKTCFLKHPAVLGRAEWMADLLVKGDGMTPKHALQWVVLFYMGGDLYANGLVVAVPPQEKIINKIKKLIKNKDGKIL